MKTHSIKVGDPVPRFSLLDQHGELVSIEKFLGKPFVIFFYPKDDTPGCTAESCGFRDVYGELQDFDAQAIGISADSPSSHKAFAGKYDLPFVLLSDTKNEVRKIFGISTGIFGWFASRVTYIMDGKGMVRHIFESQLKARQHVREALEHLKRAAVK